MFNKLLTLCLSILVILMPAMPVNAKGNAGSTSAEVEVDVKVKGGSLSIETDNKKVKFKNITIDGEIQELNADLEPLKVMDFRGEGAGWNITVKADVLPKKNDNNDNKGNNGNNGNEKSRKFPEGSLQLTGIESIIPSKNTPSDQQPDIIDNGPIILNNSAQRLLAADSNKGMGQFTIKLKELRLTINTNEILAGDYKSKITYTIVSGPGNGS